MTMNIQTMTIAERERLAYAEGYPEAAKLLAELDDLENERDSLQDENEGKISIRYFIIDYDLKDGPEAIECDECEFLQARGTITYKRHTVWENGVDQICLTKDETSWTQQQNSRS